MKNKRYLILDNNNIAVNDIICGPNYPITENMIEASINPPSDSPSAGIGWSYINNAWVEPALPIPTSDENKQTAIELLSKTDWTAADDVGNPQKANPYLQNQAEFIAWRSQIRAIAISPTEGYFEIFAQIPKENWATI